MFFPISSILSNSDSMLGITSRLVCFISVLKEVVSRIRSSTEITLSVVLSGEGCEQPAVVSFLSLSTDNSDWSCLPFVYILATK